MITGLVSAGALSGTASSSSSPPASSADVVLPKSCLGLFPSPNTEDSAGKPPSVDPAALANPPNPPPLLNPPKPPPGAALPNPSPAGFADPKPPKPPNALMVAAPLPNRGTAAGLASSFFSSAAGFVSAAPFTTVDSFSSAPFSTLGSSSLATFASDFLASASSDSSSRLRLAPTFGDALPAMMVLSWCLPPRTRVFELAESQVELFPGKCRIAFSFLRFFEGKKSNNRPIYVYLRLIVT